MTPSSEMFEVDVIRCGEEDCETIFMSLKDLKKISVESIIEFDYNGKNKNPIVAIYNKCEGDNYYVPFSVLKQIMG